MKLVKGKIGKVNSDYLKSYSLTILLEGILHIVFHNIEINSYFLLGSEWTAA